MIDSDPLFGGFVENCVYDKSLGPGMEKSASVNMIAYLKHKTMPPVVTLNTSAPATSAPATSAPATSAPATSAPATSAPGPQTSPSVPSNFSVTAIMQQHVTVKALDIPAGSGVTYQLKYVVPLVTSAPLVPALQPRPIKFTGAAAKPMPSSPTTSSPSESSSSSSVDGSGATDSNVNLASNVKPVGGHTITDDHLKVRFDLDAPMIVVS